MDDSPTPVTAAEAAFLQALDAMSDRRRPNRAGGSARRADKATERVRQ